MYHARDWTAALAEDDLETAAVRYRAALRAAGGRGLGTYVAVQSALSVLDVLERVNRDMERDPYPRLIDCLDEQVVFLERMAALKPLMAEAAAVRVKPQDAVARTRTLFEEAWTVYAQDSYEHSVGLIKERLAANGFDDAFFAGKRCFDGGCGTARFAVAMAELGAAEVVAADIGADSLAFARARIAERGLTAVELVEQDVTNLGRWGDGAFDFVVSNGVLHHAEATERGLTEHFRVTRPGGVYWLYLYGAGGFYWHLYDRLKEDLADIEVNEVKRVLLHFGLRAGTVYTFLDNVCAPIRKYYLTSEVEALLRGCGDFAISNLKGTSTIDDTEKVLASRYGRAIYGPEGEVRVRIDKRS